MQIFGRITWKGEAQNYQTRNGETRTLMRVRLTAGSDNMVLTAFSEQIGPLASLTADRLVVADVSFASREWQASNGTTQHSTEVMLNRIAPL